MNKTASALSPETDVVVEGRRFIATSTEPWLAVVPGPALRPGKFVTITYRSSFWDEPVRPVFRFWLPKGDWHDRITPGPVAGTAIWTVRVPSATTRVSVSPTNRMGRFDFEILSIREVSFATLLARGISRHPRAARSTILTRLIGWTPESDVNLDWATGSTPFAAYRSWRKDRAREVELTMIDEPRFDWATGPVIHLVADTRNAHPDHAARTIASLQAQVYPRWRLDLVADRGTCDWPDEPRIGHVPRSQAMQFLLSRPHDSLVAPVSLGDELYPFALGAVAEAATRLRQTLVFYGDEDYRSEEQKLVPVFKPGWSPLLQAGRPYLGRAVFLRPDVLADWTEADCIAFLSGDEIPAGALARLDCERIKPLRRILLTRASPWLEPFQRKVKDRPVAGRLATNPSALIVIPTRDQPVLLGRCIESVFTRTEFDNFSVVIVDNGSVDPRTRRLFAAFRGDKAITVLRSPGDFNFSALCNAGAARRKCDVLVFLNDDTEILAGDWLEHLVAAALLPHVGAVGGLLLYPNRRIQHAGVVLGTGNSAGHFGARAKDGTPGWLGRNEVAHEVSAVTGACLAVERQKFMQVGGFDAEHLPVEQNDIDLCLRLAERGWIARFEPKVRLVHTESASRGTATFRRLEVYAEQRRWLHRRWLGALRDDPYFHPGLSLYSLEPALS